MIVSPRAEEVIDIVRKAAGGFIKIDEVFLYYRTGEGADAQWQKNTTGNDCGKIPTNRNLRPLRLSRR